ncbi:MAG: outer membrane protein assembly factor BamA [Alphaproteobacteria bacterium]|nr:outer membrane protein assembly factor BamA [Alphaproteobacteria bacterium]
MRYAAAALAVLLLLLVAAGQAAAQRTVVSEIAVQGNQRIEAETVRSYMLIAPGDLLDVGKVDASLKALFATGLFADVTMRQQGNALVVSVVENPIINRLAFEGNRRIQDKVLEQEVQLRPRTVYTRSRVQGDVQRILQLYRRSGRFAATVEPKVIQLPQNRVDLVFEINEGGLTGIRKIDFIGNRAFSDSRLREAIATKESAWYRFLSSDDSYDPDRLTLDRELLRKYYLSRGYADFRVSSAVAELTPDRRDFFVTFAVEEGQLYRFGKIDLQTTLNNADIGLLKGVLKSVPGAVYNAEQVEQSVEDLTFELGRQGYAFVDVTPRVSRQRDGLVIDIVYEVAEGPRVYVERINITGNVRTLDKVVRREFRLVEGDAFNAAKLRRSRQRIRSLGFFEKVDVAQQPGSAPDRVVINADVQERSTGELSFGAGFSTAENVVGDVQIRERNLLGRGQDLRIGLSISSIRQQVDIAFTEPYFLDRDLSAGFDLFNIRRDLQRRSRFDETSRGGRLRSGFALTENLRSNVRYTLRDVEISNIRLETSDLIRREEGSELTSAVGYELVYDLRDDRIEPSSGWIVRFGQEFAGLGGDVLYIQNTTGWSYYYPFTPEVVGNLSIRGGYIDGLGEDISVTNRFFLGGDAFHGFRNGGVGPRDRVTGDSIGGNVFYLGAVELRFPIGLARELGINGRLFTEIGAVTDVDASSPNLQDTKDPRVSIGTGLTWRSPFGPIRVDVATPVVKEPFDRKEIFRFSFGTRF